MEKVQNQKLRVSECEMQTQINTDMIANERAMSFHDNLVVG